jgi:hypothetical protein
VLLYALTPVDAVAVSYNVNRILRGDSSATMQIGVQPIDTEGVLALSPLLNCGDSEIQAGVRALLADRYHRLREARQRTLRLGWTSRQLADEYALEQLQRLRVRWSEYDDQAARRRALKRFYDYAYQWY